MQVSIIHSSQTSKKGIPYHGVAGGIASTDQNNQTYNARNEHRRMRSIVNINCCFVMIEPPFTLMI